MAKGQAIDFVIRDAFGNSAKFEDTLALRRFLRAEKEAWLWLQEAPHEQVDMASHVLGALDRGALWVEQFESGQMNYDQLTANLASFYTGEKPTCLMSEFAPGSTVGLIRASYGSRSAEKALAFLTGKSTVRFDNLDDFGVWQLLSNPSLIKAEGWIDEQRRAIGNARRALSREIDRYSNETAEMTAQVRAVNASEVRRYRRLANRTYTRARRRGEAIEASAAEKIANIESTRAAYAEQMRLKAPVRYWTHKKRVHSTSALRWGLALGCYLACVLIGAYSITPRIWRSVDAGEALSARHFLLVAGVGALLTLLFWMARLLVRIYLGERHLATDAEERMIMTQAYLALIKEGAASDQERVVILSSLFRSAQDGIVKDEGASDISLPAIVAAALDSKRTA